MPVNTTSRRTHYRPLGQQQVIVLMLKKSSDKKSAKHSGSADYTCSDSENLEYETEEFHYTNVEKIVRRMLVTIKPVELQAVPGVILIFSRICPI
jgi:hypothetical protein